MSNIENACDVLLKALTGKNIELSDALDIAARENNEKLAAELSEKCVRIDAALISLDEVVNALRAA